MTVVGYLLMTVISHSVMFDTPTMAATQVLLPPDVNCEQAAKDLLQQKIATDAYCIPIYNKG